MNNVSIIGRLTRDPQLDRTASGTDVCRIRLAIPRRRREGRDQGAVFVTVVAYGGQASAAADVLVKGRQVAVTGRLEQREWTSSDGSRQSVHEVVADHVLFLAQPNGNEPNGNSANGSAAADSQTSAAR